MIKCHLDIIRIKRMCYKGYLTLVTFFHMNFSFQKYKNCTHLIADRLCKSEKFLAACAAGKLTAIPPSLKKKVMLKKRYLSICGKIVCLLYQT